MKYFFYLFSALLIITIGCKKSESTTYYGEPIAFVTPDTNWISATAGSTIPLTIALGVDKPIDSLEISYNVDSTNSGFNYGDPTAKYYTTKYTDKKNTQTFDGSFILPANATKNRVVRIVFDLYAQNNLRRYKVLRVDVK